MALTSSLLVGYDFAEAKSVAVSASAGKDASMKDFAGVERLIRPVNSEIMSRENMGDLIVQTCHSDPKLGLLAPNFWGDLPFPVHSAAFLKKEHRIKPS